MNKEELMTLLPLQGTSHCSCLEHCFSFFYPKMHCLSNPVLRGSKWDTTLLRSSKVKVKLTSRSILVPLAGQVL